MEHSYSIGIDLGGTNLRAALISKEGVIGKRVKVSSSGDVLGNIIDAVKSIFSPEVKGIGIAIAGTVDKERGIITESPNLNSIENIPIVNVLNKEFSVPAYLDNDASLAALGESVAGAGKDFNSFVLLTLGTGIGCGVIYEKKLMNIASELGHITVEAKGVKCHCGNPGCLEAYAGGWAVVDEVIRSVEAGESSAMKDFQNGDYHRIMPGDVYAYAVKGDALAVNILKRAGFYLGVGIAGAINIFSPDAVILTGGLMGAWDIYVKEALKEASERSFETIFKKTKILPSTLGDDAGIIGAANLAYGN